MSLSFSPEEQGDIDSSFEALEDTCLETGQDRVLLFIESTLSAAILCVQSLKAPSITLRTIKHVQFSESLSTNVLERQIIDREVTYSFPGKNEDEASRFTCVLGILLQIYGAILNGVTVTKREIYYQDPLLYKQQSFVDRYVDDVAYTCRATRKDLNVVCSVARQTVDKTLMFFLLREQHTMTDHLIQTASPKGLVAGLRQPDHLSDGLDKNFQIICDLDVDMENLEETLLPQVTWILLVEKEATFNTLVQRSFHTNPALGGRGLLVTGKGYPDLSTRLFLRACLDHYCWKAWPPPIFGLCDCDPHGLGILQNYRLGSTRLAHEVAAIVPELKWLGLKTNDIVMAGEDASIMPLTQQDRSDIRGLLHRQVSYPDAVSQEVVLESHRMLMLNKKAEIQILDERPGRLCQWLQHKLWHEMHGPA